MKPFLPPACAALIVLLALPSSALAQFSELFEGYGAISQNGRYVAIGAGRFESGKVVLHDRFTHGSSPVSDDAVLLSVSNGAQVEVGNPDQTYSVVSSTGTVLVARDGMPALVASDLYGIGAQDVGSGVIGAVDLDSNGFPVSYSFDPATGQTTVLPPQAHFVVQGVAGGTFYGTDEQGNLVIGDQTVYSLDVTATQLRGDVHTGQSFVGQVSSDTLRYFELLPFGYGTRDVVFPGTIVGFSDLWDKKGFVITTAGAFSIYAGVDDPAMSFLAGVSLGTFKNGFSRADGFYANSVIGGRNVFSGPQAVPEPATLAALGLGALGILRRRATGRK